MTAPVPTADRHLAIDALDKAIVNLSARINASTYELLVLIREFDERAGWLKWGLESCSQWLHWRCDLSRSAAREKVRIAHALKALPEIAMAFSEGRLSYSKVRALTRVVTPQNEDELLRFALSTTAARVEERCHQMRNTQPGALAAANQVHARREVRAFRDVERDRGCSFPGCAHTRYVDAHHIRHWADGGETSMENTMLLCGAHHRLVHEGGYEIRKDHSGGWYFRRPDGRAIPRCGYQTDDMVDDGIDDVADAIVRGASAEAPEDLRGYFESLEVREAAPVYLAEYLIAS